MGQEYILIPSGNNIIAMCTKRNKTRTTQLLKIFQNIQWNSVFDE